MARLTKIDWTERTNIKKRPRPMFLVKNNLMENFSSIEAKNPATKIIKMIIKDLSERFSPNIRKPRRTVIATRKLKSGEITETSNTLSAVKYRTFPRARKTAANKINV